MKQGSFALLLAALMLVPTQAQELTQEPGPAPVRPARPHFQAVQDYYSGLVQRRYSLETQGILIESYDGSTVIAENEADTPFNPASVTKVATTFAALVRFGPDHRFRTAFQIDGKLNAKTKVLTGDLVLVADGDPAISATDLNRLIRKIAQAGVRRVTGNLVIVGPFTYGRYFEVPTAARRLLLALRRQGITIKPQVKFESVSRGTVVAAQTSGPLRDIILYTNAYSDNDMADRLGTTLGGPGAVEDFVWKQIGENLGNLYIERTSGLGLNRITARATIALFRQLVNWLDTHSMTPQDIMPVAGIDNGTLHLRFTDEDARGAIVAKTGTMNYMDGGVSALAGVMYTRMHGPVLFTIYNTKGRVRAFRTLQDQFLKNLLIETGGVPAPVSESSRRLGN